MRVYNIYLKKHFTDLKLDNIVRVESFLLIREAGNEASKKRKLF